MARRARYEKATVDRGSLLLGLCSDGLLPKCVHMVCERLNLFGITGGQLLGSKWVGFEHSRTASEQLRVRRNEAFKHALSRPAVQLHSRSNAIASWSRRRSEGRTLLGRLVALAAAYENCSIRFARRSETFRGAEAPGFCTQCTKSRPQLLWEPIGCEVVVRQPLNRGSRRIPIAGDERISGIARL